MVTKNNANNKKKKSQYGGSSNTKNTDESITIGSNTLTYMTIICVIGMCFMLGLVIYLLYKNSNQNQLNTQENLNDFLNPNKLDLNINIKNDNPELQNKNRNMISYPEYLVNKSYERIINPLLPPERSYEQAYGVPINIPSRGTVGGFQQLGHLYKSEIANSNVVIGNSSETAILPLYGRPLYNGSRKWTYYTSSDKMNMIKLPITINGRKCDQDFGCEEINSGNTIDLPPYNGKFTAEMYEYDKPRYIPYVY